MNRQVRSFSPPAEEQGRQNSANVIKSRNFISKSGNQLKLNERVCLFFGFNRLRGRSISEHENFRQFIASVDNKAEVFTCGIKPPGFLHHR
jgi:hypothetical protein